jgi:hypothetical protein
VVGRQLVSNKNQPAKDDSIADLISRLSQLRAGPLVVAAGG